MLHLDDGTIHAWLDGELPPDEAESAARHVAGCAECRARVVEARGLLAGASRIVAALDAGPAGVIPPSQSTPRTGRRPWYRFAFTPVRMSIAATILVAAGLTLTARHAAENSSIRGRLIDSQINATTATSAQSVADSVSAKAVARTENRMKTVAKASKPIATETADMSVSKPTSPALSSSNAAGLERRALQADKQAAANVPRQISAASSPPAAEAAPPAARLDTARAKDEMAKVATDSLRRAPAAERRQAAFVAGNVNQLQEAVVTGRDAANSNVVILRDCYRLAIDSTEWRGILPSGFALVEPGSAAEAMRAVAAFAPSAAGGVGGARGDAARRAEAQPVKTVAPAPAASPAPMLNAVRALDSSGRLGSAVIGSWAIRSSDTIAVRLATADPTKPVTLVLTRGTHARVSSSDRADSVRVTRASCVR